MINKNAALLVTSNQYPETPSHWEGYLDNQNLNNDKLQKVLYLFIKKEHPFNKTNRMCAEGRVKVNIQIPKDPNIRPQST